jgi:hypothetical protein
LKSLLEEDNFDVMSGVIENLAYANGYIWCQQISLGLVKN